MESKKQRLQESTVERCCECLLSGSLIQCTGDCKRFFHHEWLSLVISIIRSVNAVITQGEPWLCPDCQKGVVGSEGGYQRISIDAFIVRSMTSINI